MVLASDRMDVGEHMLGPVACMVGKIPIR